MEGDGAPELASELPALEPVGSELDLIETTKVQARGTSRSLANSSDLVENGRLETGSTTPHQIVREPVMKTSLQP